MKADDSRKVSPLILGLNMRGKWVKNVEKVNNTRHDPAWQNKLANVYSIVSGLQSVLWDSKNLGQWMGPIWQAQLWVNLAMLIGPSFRTQFIALLGTKFGDH